MIARRDESTTCDFCDCPSIVRVRRSGEHALPFHVILCRNCAGRAQGEIHGTDMILEGFGKYASPEYDDAREAIRRGEF